MSRQGQKQVAKDRTRQQPSDTVEDLQPREDESAGVKGGCASGQHMAASAEGGHATSG